MASNKQLATFRRSIST